MPHEFRDPRIRKAVTLYDMIAARFPEFFDSSIVARFKRRLRSCRDENTWVLAISHSTKDDFCEFTRCPPSRVFVTHLAADDIFHPERDPELIRAALRRHGIPEGPFLLSVCTLEPRKNLHTVIRAFADLVFSERIKDLSLVLVGNAGWQLEKIGAEFEKYPELRERVIFPGFVPDEDLRAVYSGAIGFVYMSLYEGFGLPPLEAMQCGVPVITSNASSLPEVVGNAAILLPPQDATEISGAMLRLYRDGGLRQKLAAAGIERARQFSWDKCATDTLRAYREMLAQG